MASSTDGPILRVGTTGDYPPVTFHDARTGRFSGQDIALIEAFARDRQQTTPGLCAVRPDQPYTRVDKVFLFRKDQGELHERFDRWFAAQPRASD